jgi:hypothetical protein
VIPALISIDQRLQAKAGFQLVLKINLRRLFIVRERAQCRSLTRLLSTACGFAEPCFSLIHLLSDRHYGAVMRPRDRRQIEALAWLGHGSRVWPIQGWQKNLHGNALRLAREGRRDRGALTVSTRCSNKFCVRHLYTRTRAEIMASGQDSHLTRTTAKTVLQLRKLYAKGDLTQAMLAKRFGLSPSNVKSILVRRSWKHI